MPAETETRQRAIKTNNASACPVVEAIKQVGTPWRLNVIYALKDGEQRFNELKTATEARSKTLSDALDVLLENDIATRRIEDEGPVAVYYDLTTKGVELHEVLEDLNRWAQSWGEEVPEAPDSRLQDH